ncbi:CHAT domain-containing protein [Catelliglobosispora koreensis]|uniref:CHAT domain-containing protein n=1 Tax=Catelliglobosispora koreensis TaxID=129052 RepID=UPI0003631722|nr:CHAT domain-containing protein [Catelliglobosispora koreensis]
MTADGLDNAFSVLNSIAEMLENDPITTRQALSDAVDAVRVAIGQIEAELSGKTMSTMTARAFGMKAELHLRLGDLDGAVESFAEADSRYKRAGASEEYGLFLLQVAEALSFNGFSTELAERYAEAASDILNDVGSGNLHHADRLMANLRRKRTGTASQTEIDALRHAVEKAPPGRQRGVAAQALVVALHSVPNVKDHLQEIHDTANTAFRDLWKHGTVEDACTVLFGLHDLYRDQLKLPSWAGNAVSSALERAREAGRLDLERDMLAVGAALLDQDGEPAAALAMALEGVARHDEHLLMTKSSHVRDALTYAGQKARETALHLAVAMNSPELAAELIESARLQVLPDDLANSDGQWAGRLLGLRPISVGGESRVAKHYRAGRVGAPLSLETAINRVGGESASWWGVWAFQGAVHWTLLHRGVWSCGRIPAEPGTELHELLRKAIFENDDTSIADRITGDWCRNVASEEFLAADLGELLIPPRLRAAVLAAEEAQPISLVLAGNLHAILPICLLGVRENPFIQAVRLIESAVLRVAPPAVILEQISNAYSQSAGPHEIIVACVDPRGDLKNSRTAPDGARVVLGSPTEGRKPASRENLIAALETNAGEAGIFYYSGHAISPGRDGLGGDYEDGLVLSNGETLSAADLFGPDGGSFNFPPRSIISACSSSGAAGGAAGEWLGLAAALLWRGSRQIIATNWSIWDTRFTTRFDLALAMRLREASDVAWALREAQLAALREWRASQHDFTNFQAPGLPGSSANLALPLIWASYCCVGTK